MLNCCLDATDLQFSDFSKAELTSVDFIDADVLFSVWHDVDNARELLSKQQYALVKKTIPEQKMFEDKVARYLDTF
jgi:hypothetical protein